jgi:hypothetical protein
MNSEKFPVFSPQGYSAILKHARAEGFSFITFREKEKVKGSNKKWCLIRHDVDTSLKCALEMGEIEAEHGVRATYFLMLRSPAHNLFSRYAFDAINRLKELGHEIALHFDGAHPATINRDISDAVLEDVRTLSLLSNEEVKTVSFHQPSSDILKGDLKIQSMINTYNKSQMEGWYYCSDSNRVWKEHNALSVFEDNRYSKIQILIHPIWWMYSDLPIEDVWDKAIVDNFRIMQQQFLDTEGAYGSERKFFVER